MSKFIFRDREACEEEEFKTYKEALAYAKVELREYLECDGWMLDPDNRVEILEVRSVATWVNDGEKENYGSFRMKPLKELKI